MFLAVYLRNRFRSFKEQWFCVKDFRHVSGYRCCDEFCKNWICPCHPKHGEYLERLRR